MKMEREFVADRVLSEPTPQNLSTLLRHKELWPKGFQWDFRYARSCAVGLFNRAYPDRDHRRFPAAYDMFNFPTGDIFCCSMYEPVPDWDVTPEMVADRIDRMLANAV